MPLPKLLAHTAPLPRRFRICAHAALYRSHFTSDQGEGGCVGAPDSAAPLHVQDASRAKAPIDLVTLIIDLVCSAVPASRSRP
jgi:hypothetical protein